MFQAKTQEAKRVYEAPQADTLQCELSEIVSTSSVYEGNIDGSGLF
jgi:hypothetical protein